MKLIVGLGNPGDTYAHTRHNAGRLLVEYIAARESARFFKKKATPAFLAQTEWDKEEVLLAVPATFMNLSGEAVAPLLAHFKINPKKDLLAVVDDAALPFGRLRLRSRGSDGGHNGLKSIQQVIGSSDYARLRIGIAPGEDSEISLEEYVLSGFNAREKKVLPEILQKGYEACCLWATRPMAAAMNVINPLNKKG